MATPSREAANPPVPGHVVLATAVEAAVLAIAGAVLFFAPGAAEEVWGWELTPFNTRFLGAVYLGSLVAVAVPLVVRRWAPARLVVPMILVYTTVALLVSVVYVARFDSAQQVTWAWFVIFVAVPAHAAYALWSVRHGRRAPPSPPPRRVRVALLAAAVPLAGYGVGLLIAPVTVTRFWPWPVDTFHGRLYSAVFLTLAVGAALLARAAARVELATLGVTCVVLGAFQVAGLLAVDADANRVDWGRAGTVAWIALFAAMCLGGAALSGAAVRRETPIVRPASR